MNDELNMIDWNTIFHNKTINDNYSNVLSIVNRVCDKHIPSKVVVIRPDAKHVMNISTRKAIRKRDRIHYKAKFTNRPEHWLRYKQTRNGVISLVRLAKEKNKKRLTSQLTDTPPPPW
jgi:hypothetical protein